MNSIIRVNRNLGPLFLHSFPIGKRRGGGGRGIFSVQDYVIYTLYEFSGISLFVCLVAPYLNQVFRRCFSMDNLKAYAEDDTASSTSRRPPPSSEGLSTSSSSLTSSMAVPTTQVTSGPVPAVSAPTTPAPTVIQDRTVALDPYDGLPPPHAKV